LRADQVEELARRYRLRWEGREIDRVMELVGGHPYLGRVLMHRAALHATPPPGRPDGRPRPPSTPSVALDAPPGALRRSRRAALAARVARDPKGRLEPEEHRRLAQAGVIVEEADGSLRLRNRLYEIAVASDP